MKFYFAPMEGVTGYNYRNAHHAYFRGVDKYFTPFIVTNQSIKLRTRELEDIRPDHNEGLTVVPQILSNQAHDFIETAKRIVQLGYDEINLNLGCPSGTVVAKHRGSGFLSQIEELDRFLDEVIRADVAKLSIKTRIGVEDPTEFYKLLEIYNRYPLEELIIHPRIQKQYYKGTPDLEIFGYALGHSKNPICYNGDINTVEDYQKFMAQFPQVDRVMIGRGALANPALFQEIKGEEGLDKETFRQFHSMICEGYEEIMSGDRNVMFKMKELWFYMSRLFPDQEKCYKKIRKVEKLADYKAIVRSLLREDLSQ
ncbi:probable transcriptional regulator [Lachnospiraceae bacterium KM106-2]|nr:probable transcriptional regulator [Lachnospiraceae bacterium KM106-2]